jgi:hypothetical protein
MSGGHFDYQDNILFDIIDQIKYDIKYNDISWENANDDNYGFQHSKETIKYLKKIIKLSKKVADALHAYDWYVSGDTCEETFLEKCKELKL